MTDEPDGDDRPLSYSQDFIEALPDGLLVVESSGIIQSANAQALQLFGYARNELVGQPIEILVPQQVRAGHPGLRDDYFGDPGTRAMGPRRDVRGKRKDGTEFPAEISLAQLDTVAGPVAVATVRDVTERRRSEEEARRVDERVHEITLQEANERVEHEKESVERFFELSLDLLCIANVDGYFKRVNPAFTDTLGYDEDELLGRPFLEFVHPSDQEGTLAEVAKLEQGQRAIRFENRYRCKDGSWKWLSWNSAPASDGKLYAVARDITAARLSLHEAERQAKTALKHVDLHEKMMEQMPIAVLIGRLEDRKDVGTLRWISANSAAELMTQSPPAEYIDRTLREAFPEIMTTDLPKALMSAFKLGKTQRLADFEWRPGTFVDILAVPLDRTTIAVLAEDLAARRELELQMRAAQRMEAVGRLAGGVAHDFNNLLTAIFSFGRFVLEDMHDSDPAKADVEEILKAAERAESLTRQLLAFSRRQTVDPKVLSINQTVEAMDKMLRRILGEDVALSTHLAEDLWNVRVDPGALDQVIVNLAVNARDAMSRGGKLTLETDNATLGEGYESAKGARVPPGEYVAIIVSDSGEGMDEQTQQSIFEPFFTTKAAEKGTGLGLSTVYGIVKQADGFIWVYSEVGKGTTFKIYLPRIAAPTDSVSRSRPAAPLGGSETVLIVEDDDQVRALVKRSLTRAGYDLLVASNGGEALLTVEAHDGDIDLLVTDVVMPQMGGKQLVEKLGRMRPKMKVLYMSGYTPNAIVHHGVLERGTALLQKPFTPSALVERTREVLDSDAYYAGATSSKPRILIIDDDPRALSAAQRVLKSDYDVTLAGGAGAAFDLLKAQQYDLILCDVLMPDMTGDELHEQVRDTIPEAAEKFVFVTGLIGHDFVDAFMERTSRPILEKPLEGKRVEELVGQLTRGS